MKTKTPGITKAAGGSLAKAVEGMLPEIRGLIEGARHRAVTAANLSMVTLYWKIGRILTRDIQRGAKRGGYGERLLEGLASRLTREYGQGFSISNLWDMRRFFEAFEIPQPAAVESAPFGIPQPVAVESSKGRLTGSTLLIRQPLAGKSVAATVRPPPTEELLLPRQTRFASPALKVLPAQPGKPFDDKAGPPVINGFHADAKHLGDLADTPPFSDKTDCRCKDPKRPRKHGPYYQLSYTWRGKSQTVFVSQDQVPEVEEQIANYRRFRTLFLVAFCSKPVIEPGKASFAVFAIFCG